MGGKGNHRTCVICGVKERHSDLCGSSLFAQFPLDENRCKAWLKVVGNEDLVHVPIEKLHQLRHVCGNHFTKRDFNKKRNRLRKRAIPTINLTATPLTDAQLIGFPQHIVSKQQCCQYGVTLRRLIKGPSKKQRTEMSKNVSVLVEPQKKMCTPSSDKATSSRAEMLEMS